MVVVTATLAAPDIPAKVAVKQVHADLLEVPLSVLLADITRQTGVRLQTAADYEDRAVTAVLRDVPLADLMTAIAALFGDEWVKRDGGRRYVLIGSRQRRALQLKKWQEYESYTKATMINKVRRLAVHGPEPWELPPADVAGPEFAEEYRGRGIVLAMLSEELVDHLFSGGSIRIPLVEAQGDSGAPLWDFVRRFAMREPRSTEAQRAAAAVRFSVRRYAVPQGEMAGLPLTNLMFAVEAPTASSAYDIGPNLSDLQTDLRNLAADALLPRSPARSGGEARRHQQELLAQPVRSSSESNSRAELLRDLANSAAINLLADSHTKPSVPVNLASPSDLESALKVLDEAVGISWAIYEPSILTVRSRYWWLDDAVEPPASKVVEWAEALESGEQLSLETAAEIAALPLIQHKRLAHRLPRLQVLADGWLHLYGNLSARQQAQVRGSGLPLWTLPMRQRQVLVNREWNGASFGPHLFGLVIERPAALLRILRDEAEAAVTRVTFALEPVPDATGRISGHRILHEVLLPQGAPASPEDSARSR